jgi:AraC-like DNA-binding protein
MLLDALSLSLQKTCEFVQVDSLSRLVALLRPQRLRWKAEVGLGPWSRNFPASCGVSFCLPVEGGCTARVSGRQAITLAAGDFLMLASPPSWTLADDRARQSQLVGGYFSLSEDNASLLLALVPNVVVIPAALDSGERLRQVINLIGDEARADRPGRSLILEHLLEVLVLEAIRHRARDLDGTTPGLLAGLAEPGISAALRAIHDDAGRPWSLESLASVAAMSRSGFAARFVQVVGKPPRAYLQDWRMALAKDALGSARVRLDVLAASLGYQSASAFSAAFSRAVGCSPARYASTMRQGVRQTDAMLASADFLGE